MVPKQETDYIFDIDDEQLGEMMVFAALEGGCGIEEGDTV